jgi:hypothetical protein
MRWGLRPLLVVPVGSVAVTVARDAPMRRGLRLRVIPTIVDIKKLRSRARRPDEKEIATGGTTNC